jgi:hypothetical protein
MTDLTTEQTMMVRDARLLWYALQCALDSRITLQFAGSDEYLALEAAACRLDDYIGALPGEDSITVPTALVNSTKTALIALSFHCTDVLMQLHPEFAGELESETLMDAIRLSESETYALLSARGES